MSGKPPKGPLADAEPLDGGFVDLDPEARTVGQRDLAVAQGQRAPDQVLDEIEMGEAHAPVDIRYCAGEVDCGGAGDARFGHPGCDVHLEAKASAHLRGFKRADETTELAQLERDATGPRLCIRLDVGDCANALVDPDWRVRRAREALEAREVVGGKRLLDANRSLALRVRST